jgi:hypothetical protein
VLVDHLRAVLHHLLRLEFTANDGEKRLNRVLHVITQHAGIKRGALLKKTGYGSKQQNTVIDTLRERGDVYEEQGGSWASGSVDE